MQNLLARLRAETAPLHASIERAVDLLSPQSGLAGYARYLARFHSFLRAFEPRLTEELASLGFAYAPRGPLAAQDLHSLGRSIALAGAPPLPDPSGIRAVGCGYVLEGSTLGGQLIARALEERHGAQVAAATSFLRPDGDRPGARWAAFRTFAASLQPSADAEGQAVEAACATFRALEQWLGA